MALIDVGSFDRISVRPRPEGRGAAPVARIYILGDAPRKTPAKKYDFVQSKDRRGFAMQSIRLEKDIRGWAGRVFNRTTNVYFLSWAWDMSGEPIAIYPGQLVPSGDCLIPIRAGERRERKFLGRGPALFMPRRISAGIELRIQIWESKKGTRQFGETMVKVNKAINGSGLSTTLATLGALSTGVAGLTLGAIGGAAVEVVGLVGGILKDRGDNYLDYYSGMYPADEQWRRGEETHQTNVTSITLNRLT
jgi:hypothetical protein